MIKVLNISTKDIKGGAAIAAYRLHRGLCTVEVDSKMLVQEKTCDEFKIIGPDTNYKKIKAIIRPFIDTLISNQKLEKKENRALFSSAWVPLSGIAEKINILNPDIVHLHWIAGGMIRIEEIAKIESPIVWSLHDMWAFTGGCHYSNNCNKYIRHCYKCPVIDSKRIYDQSFRIFKRKDKTFSKINNLTIVGLSSWIASCAKESMLFHDKRVINLPNLIDTKYFKPMDKKIARELLNLPNHKNLILYGAMNATSDPRKGFRELASALYKIKGKNIELVVFGSNRPPNAPYFGFPTHYLGRFNDDISLMVLYNSADIMIVPSLQENLSNVIMESLACSTPVVAFNIGGNSDLIEHKQNGYLAEPYKTSDLAKGVEWILRYPKPQELKENARKKIVDFFEMQKVSNRYKALYEEILNRASCTI